MKTLFFLLIFCSVCYAQTGGSPNVLIQDESNDRSTVRTLDFQGAGVETSTKNGIAHIVISGAGAGSGDVLTVNGTSVDTTGNLSDDSPINLTLTDGGPGGPDNISASLDDIFLLNTGDTGTGVYDFGGATSFEISNTAGDITCDAAGEVAVDSTNKQLGVYEGSAEVAIPLRHMLQGNITAGDYDIDPDIWILDLDATTYPNGIYITAVYVDANVADPATELGANLNYCDAVAGGAFPGANATLIKAISTTTGNFSDAAVNTAVATGKSIYITLSADPSTATSVFHAKVYFRIPES